MIIAGMQFSGPMARANWQGVKTETRRAAANKTAARLLARFEAGEPIALWQREAFRLESNFDPMNPAAIKSLSFKFMCVWHEADCGAPSVRSLSEYGHPFGRLRAAMHMPKWASRAVLDVTGMRSERLGDITAEAAMVEGIARARRKDGERFGLLGWNREPDAAAGGWDFADWLPCPRLAYFRLYARVNRLPDSEADLQRMDKAAPVIVIAYRRRRANILETMERTAA